MLNPVSVLLVEDNEDDIFFFERTLRNIEIKPNLVVLRDGQAAIDYLEGSGPYADRAKSPMPDLIFLDLKLPYRSGLDVLSWLRTHVREDIRVIVLSGSDEATDHRAASDLGANGYLVKPASAQALAAAISSA